MNQVLSPTRRATVLIAYAGFVILGLPDGLLSVAWPSIRQTFDTPLDSLGVLLLWSSVGFMVTSFASGRILSGLSTDRALLAGGLLRGLGLLGYVFSPSWPLMLVAGFANGAGSGLLDAATNTYFASHLSPRHTNWLHASFGIGSTSGPLIMSGVLKLGYSWRGGFMVAGILQLLIALAYAGTRGWWNTSAPQSRQAANQDMLSALRRPAIWLGILLFFIYTGVEASAGQWSYTLFTQARGTPPEQARLWVSLYWGLFTLGRMLFGLIANRFSLRQLVRLAMAGAAAGAALLWWNPPLLPGYLALGLIGLALAPIFPLLIADTPDRVGRQLAPHAVGFQVSAAGLGFAVLPLLIGVSAERVGLEIIGPILAGSAVLMLLVDAAATRTQ